MTIRKNQNPANEVRAFQCSELRAQSDGKLTGYAAVFNRRSENLGGFVEIIQQGAFTRSLQDGSDIKAMVDHRGIAIARTANGTLSLAEDTRGLTFEIDPPDTTQGKDIRESIRRGDVDEMSFGFAVREAGQLFGEDDDGTIVRTLTDIRLFEVSIVTFPAYPDTTVATRSVRQWQEGIDQRLRIVRARKLRMGQIAAIRENKLRRSHT